MQEQVVDILTEIAQWEPQQLQDFCSTVDTGVNPPDILALRDDLVRIIGVTDEPRPLV
jgi:hypothetical protein